MEKNLYNLFMEYRKHGYKAKYATAAAKTKLAWSAREYSGHGEPKRGEVRLRIEPDLSYDLDNLLGDTYNPAVNPEIPAATLKKHEKARIDEIEREGVVGIIGEYWNGQRWEQTDSVWGFVGDEWQFSGYDTDIMSQTLEEAIKAERICPCCKREYEKEESK